MIVKKLKDCVGSMPMMADSEIKTINDIITQNKYKNCLEWGSGNSTIYFPKTNTCIKNWMSIEHCQNHYSLIKSMVPANVELIFEKEEKKYINKPKNKKFDFILVDGINRDECMDLAFDLLEKNGSIILHDSARKESSGILTKHKSKIVLLTEGEKKLKDGYFAHRGIAVFKN